MRSRSNASLWCAILAIALSCCATASYAQQAAGPENRAVPPTVAEVRTAVEQLKSDPNLAPEHKTRTLKWKNPKRPPPPSTGLIQWIAELFKWIGGAARMVIWTVIAIVVAMFAVAIIRQLRQMELRRSQPRFDVPTHVRDLDIRPESLPDDIGATALQLWEAGEHRAALSLLYRGLLSRLVHVHEVPIKQSSTEGDCIELAENHLQQDAANYVGRLIRTWQRAVYGGKEAQASEVRDLCAQFPALASKWTDKSAGATGAST